MRKLKEFTIPFVGLKQGNHQFEYDIDNKFFEHFEYDEFNSSSIDVKVNLEKKPNMLEFRFNASGSVNVNCDVTNEPYDQPIDNELHLVVKFGDEFNDEDEELLILPHGEYQVNIQQYIYEMCVLAVPTKRVHPGVLDGSLQSEVLEKLEELTPKENREQDDEEIDPRWNQLKNLLNDK